MPRPESLVGLARRLGLSSAHRVYDWKSGALPCPYRAWEVLKPHVGWVPPRLSRKPFVPPPNFQELAESGEYSRKGLAKVLGTSDMILATWVKRMGITWKHPISDAAIAKEAGVTRQYLEAVKKGRCLCSQKVWDKIKGRVDWTPAKGLSGTYRRGRPKGSKNKTKPLNGPSKKKLRVRFTNYTWDAIVDRGEVILRCQDPKKDDKGSWWWVARILPNGTLVRCAGLPRGLGLMLNEHKQIQLGGHG